MLRQIGTIRNLSVFALVFFAGIGLYFALYHGTSVVKAQEGWTPLRAMEIGTYYGPDGSEIVRETRTFSVRKDGSTATETVKTYFGPSAPAPTTVRKIVDFARQKEWVVLEASRSVSTIPLSRNETLALSAPPASSCEQSGWSVVSRTPGDPSQFHGYALTELVQQRKLKDRTLMEKRLIAPELNCLTVKSEYSIQLADGASAGSATHQLQSLQVGSADSTLFQLEAGLVERSPSEAMRSESLLDGFSCPECQEKSGAAFDARYHRQPAL